MFEAIIRRGTLMTVAVLILCVLGVAASLRIPVQMIPDLEVRTVTITTKWPGATPQDVEKEIIIEQEEYLRTVPNLRRIISSASTGEAEVELEFPFGVDIQETLIHVSNALSQVPSYPLNVDEPRIFAAAFSDNSFMYFSVAPLPDNPRHLNMDMMHDFIDDHVRTRMERVPGVSQVRVNGGGERQVQILLDPARLVERNLSVADVRRAVTTRNLDVSGGELESGKRRYLLRTIGRFDDLEDLERLILARHGDAVIRLGDVADVQLGHFKIRDRTFLNGEPVIRLSVRRETGSNVIDIKRAMLPAVAEINESLLEPAGMRMVLTADDVVYVEDSVANVWQNLALGAALATLVMYLFLRSARATAVGVIGIPICTIAGFLGLLLAGRTINVISLAGVAFAIGMTLDNSIVVLESIELERRKGLDRFRAAVEGVRKVWPAVLASTLTTVLVFAPVVFIQQEAGQLYSDIAIAVSASILASMLVAITVIPTATARLNFGDAAAKDASANRPPRRTVRAIGWLIGGRIRRLVCVAVTFIVAAAILIGLTPPAEYLPEGEEAKVFASMNAPPGYNLSTMSEIAEELHAELLPHLAEDPKRYASGQTSMPPMDYMILSVDPQRIRIITEPKDTSQVDDILQVFTELYERYPGMRAFANRGSIIASNDGGTRSVSLDISGPSLDAIYSAASTIYHRAGEVLGNPRIQADPPTLSLSQPLVEVRPDWDRAAELGLTAEDVGFTVAALSDGAFVSEFFLEDDKIDIYLYDRNVTVSDPDRVGQLPVHTPQGTVVPLSAIAQVVETVDTNVIRRVDGRRTVTLHIIPPRSIALETGVQMVQSQVVEHLRAQGAIPADVNIDLTGASDQLQETREALSGNFLVALVLIYLLMVAIFTHWGYPLLIMTAIPLGVAGGIVGLWLLNAVGALLPLLGLRAISQPFDMISMLGFLILMGTVVNNPILIVHRSVDNMRELGMDALAAVREAVDSRLRPIAMTTITTVFGLAPLVFIPGAGTELYRGLGAIVLFGLMGATLVSLTFLPSLTVLVLSWTERRRQKLALVDAA